MRYDGSYFFGFQRQKDKITVQQNLEQAIEIVLKEKIRITAAGRTDTGVHATGMIVSFEARDRILNYYKFLASINALTKDQISITGAMEMPHNFNARFSCSEREYEYWILNTKYPDPLLSGRAYWTYNPINFNIFEIELQEILGKNNFKSFAKASSIRGKSTERQINEVKVEPSNEWKGLYRVRIRGSGFLHNMIRILMGSVLQISTGKKRDKMKDILNQQKRENAGVTLPAHGLYFNRAYYQDFPEINNLYDSLEKISKSENG